LANVDKDDEEYDDDMVVQSEYKVKVDEIIPETEIDE
jgi:hypothetical protein